MKMMYGRHFEIIHCTHKVASRKSLYDAKIQKRIHYGNKRLTMGSTQRHRAGNVAACLPFVRDKKDGMAFLQQSRQPECGMCSEEECKEMGKQIDIK